MIMFYVFVHEDNNNNIFISYIKYTNISTD